MFNDMASCKLSTAEKRDIIIYEIEYKSFIFIVSGWMLYQISLSASFSNFKLNNSKYLLISM